MKKEEIDILGLKKRAEGKSYKQIREEINNINNFSKEIKTDKKLIEKQYKIIIKLEKQIEKYKKKIFNLSLVKQSKRINSPRQSVELTLSELKKINYVIKDSNGIIKKDIKELCNLKEKKITRALSFLKRNKIISEVFLNGLKHYK